MLGNDEWSLASQCIIFAVHRHTCEPSLLKQTSKGVHFIQEDLNRGNCIVKGFHSENRKADFTIWMGTGVSDANRIVQRLNHLSSSFEHTTTRLIRLGCC